MYVEGALECRIILTTRPTQPEANPSRKQQSDEDKSPSVDTLMLEGIQGGRILYKARYEQLDVSSAKTVRLWRDALLQLPKKGT